VIDILADWITAGSRVLLAIDAPLGWPAEMGAALSSHRAGEPIDRAAHAMFRRETDRFIKRRIGKQSLDVGADRIARTAFAALAMLGAARRQTGHIIPLAWSPAFEGVVAIEVYPAATLRAHGISDRGYKAKEGDVERREVLSRLEQHFDLRVDRGELLAKVDVLDAAACVLAGLDFEAGVAMAPENLNEARREGWIWARDPAIHCSCTPAA
jgi:predicted nuclease with RNAse H fold